MRTLRCAVGAWLVAAVVLHDSRPAAAAPTFQFQSNFWVNLHHVLRAEVRRQRAHVTPRINADRLTADERAAWQAALAAYADFATRDLLFDETLVRINRALMRVRSDADLDAAGLDASTTAALHRAGPIYRSHDWARQNDVNERWIAGLQPIVAAHAAAVAAGVERVYRVTWPGEPVVVDVSADAGPVGAYTTVGPRGTAAHTVIEPTNPQIQGDMALETIFHESLHTETVQRPLVTALGAEAARQHVTVPPNLWHAIIFYTAGELTRRELGKAGDRDYTPYAYRYGVYDRGMQGLRDALERDWQPYLNGEATFDATVAALIRDAR